jgi:hypothetical protein
MSDMDANKGYSQLKNTLQRITTAVFTHNSVQIARILPNLSQFCPNH